MNLLTNLLIYLQSHIFFGLSFAPTHRHLSGLDLFSSLSVDLCSIKVVQVANCFVKNSWCWVYINSNSKEQTLVHRLHRTKSSMNGARENRDNIETVDLSPLCIQIWRLSPTSICPEFLHAQPCSSHSYGFRLIAIYVLSPTAIVSLLFLLLWIVPL